MVTQVSGSGIITGSVTASGSATITGALEAGSLTEGAVAVPTMVLATAQATTSGTSIDFTGIPSWVKRITVMFNGVSTNGASNLLLQIGSGSITSSGYLSGAWYSAGATTATTGYLLNGGGSAVSVRSGSVTISLLGSNTYIESGVIINTDSGFTMSSSGNVTLAGTLDRLRLTSVNGTDTFDAGSVNIMYEG